MEKLLVLFICGCLLAACSNNGGESGAVDDGFSGAGDTNAGLPDTPYTAHPSIDTSRGENRVDTEQRDTLKK